MYGQWKMMSDRNMQQNVARYNNSLSINKTSMMFGLYNIIVSWLRYLLA